MRIEELSGYFGDRISILIDDDLLEAFARFSNKRSDVVRDLFRKKICRSEIKNSRDAYLYIYSKMMTPTAFECFSESVPAQVDVKDRF